ncbi:MAG: hypothetical protein GF317_14360 [Candidatus Lokiarchaeota archaeon]|nr:hypothetical protein [Candidatus Lokiarchaeota archaeon]MBD3200789.1 hypothetical protein [Candidatus Lokiarchaeota archaeon]
MKHRKDHFIGTRISRSLFKPLNEVIKKKNLTISKLLRNGIFRYLMFFQREEMQNNPMLIISKNEFAFLLGKVKEDDLKELAELMFANGVITHKYQVELLFKSSQEIGITARAQMALLSRIVFSGEGQRWFREFYYNFQRSRVTIAGKHSLNRNFSIFFKYYIIKYLEKFGYNLIEENLEEEKVRLVLDN